MRRTVRLGVILALVALMLSTALHSHQAQPAVAQTPPTPASPLPNPHPPRSPYTQSFPVAAPAAAPPAAARPNAKPAGPVPFALATSQDINPDTSTSTDADATTGGRVNHLAGVAGSNTTFYAASEQGGLFKTTNTAANWTHLDGFVPQMTWDVKVDPSNTNRVYATALYDGKVASLAGIEVSTDAGATWTHPASATPGAGAHCAAVAKTELEGLGIGIRPDATQNVFVGTNCGVARSTDSGVTWTFLDPTPGSTDANKVWAVLVEAGGANGTVNICGDEGFFRSTDAGGTWTAGTGLPSGRCSLAASPDEAYVLFAAASDNNIYESDDAGSTWNLLGTPDPTPQGRTPFVVTNKRATNFDLWFGDVKLFRGGCTTPAVPANGGARRCPTPPGSYAGPFTRSVGGHDDVGDLVFDTAVSSDACPRVFASDGGAHVNTTTGAGCQSPTWQRSNVGLHALWVWNMAAQPEGGNLGLFFGVQDDGFQATVTARNNPPTWANPTCCDVFDAATDGNRTLYVSCCFNPPSPPPVTRLFIGNAAGSGGFTQLNTYPPGTIVSFNAVPHLLNLGADKQYALLTSSGVFVTADITASPVVWAQVGTGTPGGGCGMRVALSGGTPTFLLQVGNCDGNSNDQAWLHAGSGTTGAWQRIDNTNGQTGGVGIINIDPTDPTRLYASNLAPAGPRMVFSTDGGTTWKPDRTLDSMMTGSGAFTYVNQTGPTDFTGFNGYVQPRLVAFDPTDPNFIVAGGHDSGLFLSADRGVSWGLLTDPFTPGTTHVPNLPQPHHAYFDHQAGQPTAIYIGTQGRGVWRLLAKAATITYTGPATGDYNDTVTLSATLLDASTSPATPVVGATLTFQIGTQSCMGVTNGSGVASCTITLNQAPGPYTVTVSYAGNAALLATMTVQPFTITREETQLTYTGATTADYHDPVTLSATLVDPAHNPTTPIAGKTVTLSINGVDSCSGVTNASGQVSCSVTPSQPAGVYTVTATFAGDAFYLPATTSVPFTITKEETTTTYTGPTVIANGVTTSFSAVLKEDGTVPIAGRTITITLGTGATAQSCSGVTNAGGTATCTIAVTGQPLGPGTVKAVFAGDAFYLPSSDSAATILFAFLAHGSFALGDIRDPEPPFVTFWGTDWANVNFLSGNERHEAPGSFQGFITTPSTTPPSCGGTWTTSTNPAPPPHNIPSYMGVVVTSHMAVTGDDVLSGNIVHIVVVKVNPQNVPDPEPFGTGTIVATYC